MEIPHIAMLAVAAVAAVTDSRSGLIPNSLTFTALALGPAYGITQSTEAFLSSLIAIIVVGFIPYVMFRMKSLGGGDVKLFAALGGLSGVFMGLEVLIYSLMAGALVAVIAMAVKGQLQVVARNVGRMLSNPFLPKSHRRPMINREMHQLRLGISIFLGTGTALAYHYAVV